MVAAGRVITGIISIGSSLFVVLFWIYFCLVFYAGMQITQISPSAQTIIILLISFIMSVQLTVGYAVHAFIHKRVMWGILLLVFNFVLVPVYWFRFILAD